MRRLARPMLYGGTLVIVFASARYHAEFIGHYTFHTSDRAPWTIAYAIALCLAAYAFGLPDLSRDRSKWGPVFGAAMVGATVMSVLELLIGAQLLPRFVVFSSAVLVCPWFLACERLADLGRAHEEERDRVVLVASSAEQAALEDDIARDVERPVVVVASLTPSAAR